MLPSGLFAPHIIQVHGLFSAVGYFFVSPLESPSTSLFSVLLSFWPCLQSVLESPSSVRSLGGFPQEKRLTSHDNGSPKKRTTTKAGMKLRAHPLSRFGGRLLPPPHSALCETAFGLSAAGPTPNLLFGALCKSTPVHFSARGASFLSLKGHTCTHPRHALAFLPQEG